ncbi:MAG: hypothetical protein Q8N85_06350 [Candidatus Omnitrophota bacterium]|nr:hypothetical protein [Candidatus Omnitrophota bacterium]
MYKLQRLIAVMMVVVIFGPGGQFPAQLKGGFLNEMESVCLVEMESVCLVLYLAFCQV